MKTYGLTIRALCGYETPVNMDGIRIFLRIIIAALVNV